MLPAVAVQENERLLLSGSIAAPLSCASSPTASRCGATSNMVMVGQSVTLPAMMTLPEEGRGWHHGMGMGLSEHAPVIAPARSAATSGTMILPSTRASLILAPVGSPAHPMAAFLDAPRQVVNRIANCDMTRKLPRSSVCHEAQNAVCISSPKRRTRDAHAIFGREERHLPGVPFSSLVQKGGPSLYRAEVSTR